MVTMLLGGLWHGAAWTFVVWGALHGVFLLVNHAWREPPRANAETSRFRQWSARVFTFLLVIVAWVFFRAESFDAARRMFDGMRDATAGSTGRRLIRQPGSRSFLQFGGVTLAEGWPAAGLMQLIYLVVLLGIVWGLPNTQEFLLGEGRPADARLVWRPTLAWAATLGLCFGVAFTYSIISVNRVSEFIYFIF